MAKQKGRRASIAAPKIASPVPAMPAAVQSSPAPQAGYMKNGHSSFFFNWHPWLRDEREDTRAGYMLAAARTVESIQNSGWLAGAVDHSISAMIGTGLRLSAKPDFEALGMTKDAADKWARDIERRWEAWACNPIECDAAGVCSMAQMTATVVRYYYSHGEAVALLPHVDRAFSRTRTKVKLIPPHKITQDSNGYSLFQGVWLDAWGLPVAYRMMLRIGQLFEQLVTVPARDAAGRPQVVHVFEGGAEQVRGITPLAPALQIVRQFDQLSDATLQAALIQALFAATITSDAPTQDVLNALQDEDEQMATHGVGPTGSYSDYLTAKTGWYQNTKIDLGRAGRISHLFPGEKLEFNTSESPNSNYEAFAKFLLREIARCFGVTFETLTGDYTGATYSSVRMAGSEIWPIILRRRSMIPARFCQSVYDAWLEERIEAGEIKFPGGINNFHEKREAATRADWRGPPKPQADDLKTAKAHEIYKRLGLLSDDAICSELGHDWEDVYEQRAREKQMRERLGLPETDTIEPPGEVGDRLDTLDR